MNYEKHYCALIDKYGVSSKPLYGYYERHHVLPKCMGGKDVYENLTYLNARMHLLAHWFLMKSFPDEKGLKIAYATMCTRGGVKLSPIMYQIAKDAVSGDNSMLARAVVTPLGEFPTVASAAKAHGVMKAIISRKAGSLSVLHKGYYWKDNIVKGDIADGRNAHHLRKGVITPFGNFESTREAGRVIGINHTTITKRIKRGDQGYSYIN
jgi:hypothetical protein